ncbi:uncharacterized protein LOC118751446 isoform X1 [Rhagoletis pomonella]|uniref:uncharacterized protein LOC118751446 isoform X1 n=1 Tax=Rhagoletis pomonella TaxID=28610 RepID=UPI00177EAE30|nr:uncharacterized protein LOC118751446 isoform X1 [Rhagoletis pomonella]
MMENVENTNINLAWLTNADIAFITKKISKERVFGICAYAVEHGQVTAGEILSLWISKLRIVYSFENFCEEDWRRLTLCCQKNFENISNFVEVNTEHEIDGALSKLTSWLKASNTFLERVQKDEKSLHFIGICCFLKFVLDTSRRCCTILKNNFSNIDWKPLIEIISSVHISSLKLMWYCLESREEISSMDYCAFIPFVIALCANTTGGSFIDIKIKVETWKYMAKLTLRCAGYKTTLNDSQWPRVPMSALIGEVKNNILATYEKVNNRWNNHTKI